MAVSLALGGDRIMITGSGSGNGSAWLMSERTTGAVPGSPVLASALFRQREIADQLAQENGGAVPSWISAVATTQEKALASAAPGAGTCLGSGDR
jgi:hypothetical protein